MKTSTRDMLATLYAVIGAVVVFAKLQSYSWWLIGSWKGALGVVAVLGLGILLVNFAEVFRSVDVPGVLESFMWIIVGTVVIAGLFSATTKLVFLSSALLVGLAYVAELTRHLWHNRQEHPSRYLPV